MLKEFDFRGVVLNEENSKRLISMLLEDKKEVALNKIENTTLSEMFLTRVILKRFEIYKLPFMISDYFWLMSLSTFVDRPGNAMILLWICYNYHKKSGKKFLGIQEWAADVFPMGVPSNEDLRDFWESQKFVKDGLSMNRIDDPSTWGE